MKGEIAHDKAEAVFTCLLGKPGEGKVHVGQSQRLLAY